MCVILYICKVIYQQRRYIPLSGAYPAKNVRRNWLSHCSTTENLGL